MINSTRKFHILLVEDDLNLGYLMVENLEARDIMVTLAQNGNEALAVIAGGDFDLCILDIMLPGTDGITLGEQLKARHPNIPFIFVTARMQEADKLTGFETGADDYITKPFSFKELYYRIMAIQKRMNISLQVQDADEVRMHNVQLNARERLLNVNGTVKKLSRREADVLCKLMQSPGQFISRSEILKQIWGNDDYFTAKSMDVYMTRIRKLLRDEPTLEIENLYGSGYRIKQNNASI